MRALEPVTLECRDPADEARPALVAADVLPERGMLLLQLHARLPGRGTCALLESPPLDDALRALEAASGPHPGNVTFSMGGAILVPFANRIRGRTSPEEDAIDATILGKHVRLPANWSGQSLAAERYAMHGLALASSARVTGRSTSPDEDRVTATLTAGDFGGHWLSATDLVYEVALRPEALTLSVTATNAGSEALPIGIGWHPYFRFPSGRRDQARLRIPARRRALVGDYDEVLPTGAIADVKETPYDFRPEGGRALGDLFLDDCFVDLERDARGDAVCEVIDPAARYGLRVRAVSPEVRAVQVYAPRDRAYAAVEPQFNLADPFGDEWAPGVDTGMIVLAPGRSVCYRVVLEPYPI